MASCGLSPRVRGNPPHSGPGFPGVRGTGYRKPDTNRGTLGLSPRVRGNRLQEPDTNRYPGSIPACAGEPLGDSINFAPLIVHVYRSPYRTIDSLADRDRGSLLTLNCT